MSRSALVVFARRPEPGRVKTRLQARLSAEDAAALYAAMLRDALDAYATLDAAVRVYVTPEAPLPDDWLPPGATQHPQQGAGLGERLLAAFVDAFRAGFERVVVIGSDHPTLPLAFVEHAFEQLRAPMHVTIGPTDDGGYYLLGANDLFPSLFLGMTFSHDGVFAETLSRATEAAEVSVLPPWYDVDTPEDLDRLAAELAAEPQGLVRTRAFLAKLRCA